LPRDWGNNAKEMDYFCYEDGGNLIDWWHYQFGKMEAGAYQLCDLSGCLDQG